MTTRNPAPPRMSAWQRALSILGKPVLPPAASREVAPTWDDQQTEAESALREMAQERAEAESLISSVGERREALLMQPGSDDQLLSLGSEIERAQLTLERLDRVQPDLMYRLGVIKFHARNERWVRVRDAIAARLEAFTNAAEAYQEVRNRFAHAFNQALAEFPEKDISMILPRLPRLEAGRQSFKEQLDDFKTRVIELEKPPRPLMASLADFIAAAKFNGTVHPETPRDWVEICEQHLRPALPIELLASYTTQDGETRQKGAIVEVDPERAHDLVRRGRAILRT